MKHLRIAAFATIILLLVSKVSLAQMDSAAMMKNMETYSTIGDQHKMLAKFNGTWDTEISIWMAPGAPPYVTKGTAVNTMIMGGRYQETSATGNMMGMPFEGRGVSGYDNAKKIFVSSWVDNMGTGIMNMEGPWDEATKTITLTGKAVDAATLKESKYKETFKIIDDNTQVMTMYVSGPDGKDVKMMEMKYTRKK